MAKFFRLKSVRWIAVLVAILGLYALLGFQLAPRIVRRPGHLVREERVRP